MARQDGTTYVKPDGSTDVLWTGEPVPEGWRTVEQVAAEKAKPKPKAKAKAAARGR